MRVFGTRIKQGKRRVAEEMGEEGERVLIVVKAYCV